MNTLLSVLDYLFDRFQWYRRLLGGHWELWYVLGLRKPIWNQTEECYQKSAKRPRLCLGCGPVHCEDHPVYWLEWVD